MPVGNKNAAVKIQETPSRVKKTFRLLDEEIAVGLFYARIRPPRIEHERFVRNKLNRDDVVNSLPMFPTLSEAIKIAALSFTKDISKISCCI